MPFPNTREHIDRNATVTLTGMVPTAAAGMLAAEGMSRFGVWGVNRLFSQPSNGYRIVAVVSLFVMAWELGARLLGHAGAVNVGAFLLLALVAEFTVSAIGRITILARIHPTLPHSGVWIVVSLLSYAASVFCMNALVHAVPAVIGLALGWLILEAFFWLGTLWSLAIFGNELEIEPAKRVAFENYRREARAFALQQVRERAYGMARIKSLAVAGVAVLAYAVLAGVL